MKLKIKFNWQLFFPFQVPNIVPSISAVVGGVTPERYIWRLGMAFFSFPRMFDAFLYFNFFSHSPLNSELWYSSLNKLVFVVHVLQYLGLFGLSYVSSTENYCELIPLRQGMIEYCSMCF